ncbi:hypothetical protein ACVRY7_03520 [Streptococcus ictaluri]|uniref:Uncharacterized protein n=1 Tax=Streptococcus ictaluri 707-05 TaxID=764299 RepID=G5K5R1_9STRE|nr:hypothetical protein [Streptococcus ictaluri]EHI68639.1 hypothetical protein STRIC_0398 [Streptococcus ictaluri 707-05]
MASVEEMAKLTQKLDQLSDPNYDQIKKLEETSQQLHKAMEKKVSAKEFDQELETSAKTMLETLKTLESLYR